MNRIYSHIVPETVDVKANSSELQKRRRTKQKKKGLPPDECTSFEVERGEPDNNKTRRNGKKKWEKE